MCMYICICIYIRVHIYHVYIYVCLHTYILFRVDLEIILLVVSDRDDSATDDSFSPRRPPLFRTLGRKIQKPSLLFGGKQIVTNMS